MKGSNVMEMFNFYKKKKDIVKKAKNISNDWNKKSRYFFFLLFKK